MDPAQQRTRGRRRRAAPPRRAPRGKHAGKGRRALRRRRAPGGRPRPSQGGRRGKSPCKHWAAGNAPKLARRPQKVSGTHLSVPRSASCSAGGVRLAAAGSGGGSGPLSGSPRPRAGQERGAAEPPALPAPARAGQGAPWLPAAGAWRFRGFTPAASCPDVGLGSRRPRWPPRCPATAAHTPRPRPPRRLPASSSPATPPLPLRVVAPPSRDTPPAGHGRSSQAAWRLHGRTRVPRRVTPKSENSV